MSEREGFYEKRPAVYGSVKRRRRIKGRRHQANIGGQRDRRQLPDGEKRLWAGADAVAGPGREANYYRGEGIGIIYVQLYHDIGI